MLGAAVGVITDNPFCIIPLQPTYDSNYPLVIRHNEGDGGGYTFSLLVVLFKRP